MPTLSLIQSPSISISQVNQQIPTSSSQQTMPASSSNPALASPLAANALMTLISQVLSNCASPTPCTSGTASVIDSNYLFWVMILSGNISRCQGCSGKILQNSDGKLLPPTKIWYYNTKSKSFSIIQKPECTNCQVITGMFSIMLASLV